MWTREEKGGLEGCEDRLGLVPVQERRLHGEMTAAVLSAVQLDGSGDG